MIQTHFFRLVNPGGFDSNANSPTPHTQRELFNKLKNVCPVMSTGLSLGIFLVLVSNSWLANSSSNSLAWEYQVIRTNGEKLELRMQYWGSQGWELVSTRDAIVDSDSFYELVFKRPVTVNSKQ